VLVSSAKDQWPVLRACGVGKKRGGADGCVLASAAEAEKRRISLSGVKAGIASVGAGLTAWDVSENAKQASTTAMNTKARRTCEWSIEFVGSILGCS